MKKVHILRAIPGSGKSTLAEELADGKGSSAICCADDYFMHDGIYKYNPEKIGSAHLWCQQMFLENLIEGTDTIIVANTNVRERDVNVYRNMAIEHGYMVFVMTVENYHSGKNIHNVPEEVLIKMEEQLRNSIKLR